MIEITEALNPTFHQESGALLASFPGCSHLQYLTACLICVLKATKYWKREWPENEARALDGGIL